MATEVARAKGDVDSIAVPPSETVTTGAGPEINANAPGGMRVIRRNGKVTTFDASKIAVAMTKAFLAVEGGNAAASSRIHETVRTLTEQVLAARTRALWYLSGNSGGTWISMLIRLSRLL